jgi:hypothetical protein
MEAYKAKQGRVKEKSMKKDINPYEINISVLLEDVDYMWRFSLERVDDNIWIARTYSPTKNLQASGETAKGALLELSKIVNKYKREIGRRLKANKK